MLFGLGKKDNEPVPKGMKLIGDAPEQEIKLDRLTTEILKEDLGFIRMFYQKLTELLNEKLSLLDGVSEHQQEIHTLINTLGKTQELMTRANVNVLSEIRQFRTAHDAHVENVIATLNQVIEVQRQTIAGLVNGSLTAPLELIAPIENADSSSVPAQPVAQASENSSSVQPQLYEIKNENDLPPTDEVNPATEKDSENSSASQIDPQIFSRNLLEEIKIQLTDAVRNGLPLDARNAEHIPGVCYGNVWILALPPKPDGSYDSSVLQDTAFKFIRNHSGKNKDEKILAVISGRIGEKKLAKSQNAANDFKITLVSQLSDLKKELAYANSIEE